MLIFYVLYDIAHEQFKLASIKSLMFLIEHTRKKVVSGVNPIVRFVKKVAESKQHAWPYR